MWPWLYVYTTCRGRIHLNNVSFFLVWEDLSSCLAAIQSIMTSQNFASIFFAPNYIKWMIILKVWHRTRRGCESNGTITYLGGTAAASLNWATWQDIYKNFLILLTRTRWALLIADCSVCLVLDKKIVFPIPVKSLVFFSPILINSPGFSWVAFCVLCPRKTSINVS